MSPSPPDILARFLHFAGCNPAQRALVTSSGDVLTYGQLDAATLRIAASLRLRGVGRESIVALYLERSAALVSSILGVWRAGAAFVPLDPRNPPARIELMATTAEPLVTVWQGDGPLPPALARLPTPINFRDLLSLDETTQVPRRLPPRASQDLAYVMFTSGSTGAPKGVEVEDRGLTNVAVEQARLFGVNASDRVLHFAAPGFDATVFEIALALCSGAELHVMDGLVGDVDALQRYLCDNAITVAVLTPSTMTHLSDDLPALRLVCAAGEVLRHGLAQKWGRTRRLWNLYGPTEATIWATAELCDGGRDPAIGRPITGVTAHILDRHHRRVPTGVAGELALGGIGIARGYRGNPDGTADRFLAAGAGRGSRLYLTGDRALQDSDGRLYFLGRSDDQVKVRGFRIELGEVQAALCSEPGVRDAVVVVDDHVPSHERLVAYYIAHDSTSDAGALRRAAATRLPSYMVPAAYVQVDAWPLTPNGKVDKTKLLALSVDELAPSDTDLCSRTVVEDQLAAIWCESLGVETVGLEADFFAIGGESLLAAQVVGMTRRRLGVGLELRDIFVYPTISALAMRIEQLTSEPERR